MTLRLGRWMILCAALLPGLMACSLLTISTPDKPLPQRELNARVLTREYSAGFAARVEAAADDIAANSADPDRQLDTLRWKLGASKASQRAATQMAPMMALLDTWTFAEQMRQFFNTGAGITVFGDQQSIARELSNDLAADAQRLVRGLTSTTELASYQAFVDRYSRDHPLADLNFVRASVVDQWVAETNQQTSFVASVGTVAQSMSDVSDRMRMFGERAPSQAVWETRLALGESDLGRADFRQALAHAGDSLDRLTKLAESSPEELRTSIGELRASMFAISDRFDASWGQMIRTVQEQREALAVNVREEREAAIVAFDAQRAAFALDAARITDQAIAAGGTQVRGLAREMAIYGALLYLLVLGAPFVAGYYIGRMKERQVVHVGK